MVNLRELAPRGRTLNEQRWNRRHRAMCVLLALHAALVPVGAILAGEEVLHALTEGLGLAALVVAALQATLPRRVRESLVTLGLMTASALVVHVAGGATE